MRVLRRAHLRTARDGAIEVHGDPLALLMQRAGRGDQDAFADLYDATAALVHGIVLRVVRDPSHSEEVVQEVFVEIWRLAPRFDGTRGTVTSWMATMAHRRAVDRVRSEQSARNRVEREGAKVVAHDDDAAADPVIDRDHTEFERRRVRKALDRLTGIQREAVELAYFGGHTYREVAALLGEPEGTIKTRIRDGMIRLRDELGVPV
jgi:RNA polymerase sigma-70 factor, ECF subfamily